MIAVWLFVSIVLVGLVAGGLAFMALAVSTATPTMSSGVFVKVHQALYRTADPVMPIFVVGAFIATAPLAVAFSREDTNISAGWITSTAAGIAVVIILTRIGNKPINKTIARWDALNPPPQWARERLRFNRFHAWRTVFALISFLAVIVVGVALTASTTTERVWALASVLVSGLIAGGLAFMYVVVGRAMMTLDADVYVATHQATSLTATRYMTPMTLLSVISAGGLLVESWRAGQSIGALLAGVALLAALGVIVISLAFSVPLNRRIATWDRADPPAEWVQIRARWMRVHRVRTGVALLGFLVLAAGLIASL
ncbi:MAG: DUF1772 domain-containing protein [Nakamurella sp.]